MKSKLLKSRYSKLAIAAQLLAITCGCNSVITKRAVGEEPAKIVTKDWEGNWLGPDGAVNIKVVDANRGLLRVAWLEDDQNKAVMKTAKIELRGSGEWLFANTEAEDKGERGGYAWARIKNEDRQIIVWLPDDKAFAQLVTDGVLPGTLDGENVILEELEPRYLKMITSAERGVPFSWHKPLVFVRTGN